MGLQSSSLENHGKGSNTADLKWAFSLSKYNFKTNMDGFVLLLVYSIKCCILRYVDMKDGLCLQTTYASGLSQSLYVNSKMEPNPRCETHICLRWNLMLINASLFSSLLSCLFTTYVMYIFHLHSSSMNIFQVCQRWRTKLSLVQPMNSFLFKQKVSI